MRPFLFIFMITLIGNSCSKPNVKKINSNQNTSIIPAPNLYEVELASFSSIENLKFFIPADLESTYLTDLINTTKNAQLVTKQGDANINIRIDTTLKPSSYHLEIENDIIDIKAADPVGLQYALVTLIQMARHGGFPLPMAHIEDQPKFGYRGMHLDVGRHFFSVDEVKKYLDYMAYYKFNHFHWHLTEDQGWRIEIKKYPRLQEVAAYRDETLIGHYNDQPHQYDGKRYGGYYTQEEIKDIIAYATARNINVIPEIEMPGHAQAAIAAYPELGCGNSQVKVATKWGVFDDVFCPNEATFAFLEDVIDEVIALFPGKYIHIGGDECPKTAWENSPYCQKLIKEKGIESGEHGLQSYFISRMEKYINSKGKQIIGWDEILEGGLAPNATVMSWRGIEGGIEAARQNHDVVMTPGTHCYFDHYQSESPSEPLAIGGMTSVEKVYHWNPIPDSLEVDKRQYILGGQANLWTEYISDFSKLEYMAYARGMAMSEALWSVDKNYANFVLRFEKHTDFWKAKGANMAFHIYDLVPKIEAGSGQDIQVHFSPVEGAEVFYSKDDGESTPLSTKNTLAITSSGKYIFTANKGDRKSQPSELNFDLHIGTKAKISLENPPAPQYLGNGPGSIINGILGNDQKYGGSEWLGFDGKDAIGVLQFEGDQQMEEITFRFFKGEGQWIYLPKKVDVLSSDDGKIFDTITSTDDIKSETKIGEVTLNLGSIKTKYLKFVITNYGLIPAGNQGAGHKAWLFVDEVSIK